jgi:sterol desaturase/sphingolipid hydroxylase (fatty acid hydroxylase superfamily)
MQELESYIIQNEPTIRMAFFVSIIILMSSLEYIIPTRELLISKAKRWFHNIGLVFFNSILLRILFPTAVIGVSVYANNNNIGLFNLLELSTFVSIVLSIFILDFIIYFQHRFFHTIDFFWKFHKVHHCDMDYDLSTGFRFHPIEIVFSMCIKMFFVLILGVPIVAVLIFEILLSTLAVFHHSNIHIPNKIDKILKLFIVTPNMHRIHHSINYEELNSNYGFNLTIWDRMFKTYTSKPSNAYSKMKIGLKNFQDEKKTVSILAMLKIPFISS